VVIYHAYLAAAALAAVATSAVNLEAQWLVVAKHVQVKSAVSLGSTHCRTTGPMGTVDDGTGVQEEIKYHIQLVITQ